jgi:hypothetical protein
MPETIPLVSAGLLKPKKRDHLYARRQLYLNYGLLSLATILHEHGHAVRVIHGGYSDPESCAQNMASAGLLSSDHPLFLSLPSHLAVSWAERFLREACAIRRNLQVVLGGRWVVGRDSTWLKRKLPVADLIVYGTAEDRILDLLDDRRWRTIPGTDMTDSDVPPMMPPPTGRLRYDLIDNFRSYHPSIEISRGCGRGCAFCEERDVRLTQMRAPEEVIAAMTDAAVLYDDPALRFYFEASWFAPTTQWARELAAAYQGAGCRGEWRCETRADTLAAHTLEFLSRAGLRVIDVGLESASRGQLQRMNKAPDPELYLRKASAFLRTCRDLGISGQGERHALCGRVTRNSCGITRVAAGASRQHRRRISRICYRVQERPRSPEGARCHECARCFPRRPCGIRARRVRSPSPQSRSGFRVRTNCSDCDLSGIHDRSGLLRPQSIRLLSAWVFLRAIPIGLAVVGSSASSVHHPNLRVILS